MSYFPIADSDLDTLYAGRQLKAFVIGHKMSDEALLRFLGMNKDASGSYVIDRALIPHNLGLPKGGEHKSDQRGNGGDRKGFLGLN